MIKKIRITLASLMYIGMTLLFLDFTGTLHAYLGWMARMQFLPALLTATAVGIAIVAFIVIITLLFGRFYCSTVCPLGVMQDIIANIGHRIRTKKKKFYTYSKSLTIIRLLMLAVLVAAMILGIGSAVAILDPYSTWGVITSNLISPIYLFLNNILAWFAERADSYIFYSQEIWVRSLPTFLTASLMLVIITTLAWRNGRTFCNTICPVGTILGYLSCFSRLKIVINPDACRNCKQCERNCKASCIDLTNKKIDYSRCVMCGNCLSSCKFQAIAYGHKPTIDKENKIVTTAAQADGGRRAFLFGTALAATGTLLAQTKKKVDGGMAVIKEKTAPQRQQPITPPGSLSAENLAKHCTGCQLCVQACPNGVLRPSTDPLKFMQPEMSFERGHCRIECHRCSDVCPTGAIIPVTPEKKTALKIGQAVWVKKNCVVFTDEVECGNCSRHCPAGAIEMVPMDPDDEQSRKIPVIDKEICIGCGACEHLCPSRPFSAIIVEGIDVQREV